MHSVNPFNRGRKLARMLRTLLVLAQRWHTTSEIAELVEVPEWTVRRDIKMFELAGIPIETMNPDTVGRGVGGRYRLSTDWVRKFLKHVEPEKNVPPRPNK